MLSALSDVGRTDIPRSPRMFSVEETVSLVLIVNLPACLHEPGCEHGAGCGNRLNDLLASARL